MSGPQTPNVRPPAGAPGTRGASANPVSVILSKWSSFCNQARDGTIPEASAKTIRTLLAQHTRAVIIQGVVHFKKNVFEQIPPLLDPRLPHNNAAPQLPSALYEEQKRLALDDLKKVRPRSSANNAASSAGSVTGSGANSPNPTAAASSPAASSPVTTPQPSSQASPRPPSGATMARPPANAAAGRPPPMAMPDDLMPMAELHGILRLTDHKERAAFLALTPGLADRFQRSAKYYSANPAAMKAASAVQAAIRPTGDVSVPGPSGASTPSATTAPGAPIPAAAPGSTQAPQSAQQPAPAADPTHMVAHPPPPPVRPAVRPPPPIRPATPPAEKPSQTTSNAAVTSNAPIRPAPPPGTGAEPTNTVNNATTASNPNPIATGPSTSTSTNPNPFPQTNANPPIGSNPQNAASGSSSLAPRPFNLNLPPQRLQPSGPPQPPPRPIPIESEIDRRKRKVKELLAEEAPGMDIEHGVQRILSEYLDAWMDEAAEGAIRLAKHRKSGKVDLKDMALSIDMKHDLRIPGFNVQFPNRTHLPSDADRRRGRAVVPRAARKVKEAE